MGELGEQAPEIATAVNKVSDEFLAGEISGDELREKLDELTQTSKEYIQYQRLLSEAINPRFIELYKGKVEELAETLGISTDESKDFADIQKEVEEALGLNEEATDDLASSVDDLRSAYNELIDDIFGGITTYNDFQEANWAVEDAQKALTEAIKEFGEGSREAMQAQNNLDATNIKAIATAYELSTAIGATTEEQEEARKKGVELSLQYLATGEIGVGEFIRLAKQAGVSQQEMGRILEDLGVDIDTLPKEIQIAMGIDIEEPKKAFEQTYPGWMGIYKKSEPETGLHLDETEVDEKMNVWYPGMAQIYKDSEPETLLLLDDEDVDTKFEDADTLSQEWIDSKPETKILADNSQAMEAIQAVIDKSIPDKHFTIWSHNENLFAGGGVVQKYATGGLPQAQAGMIMPNIGGGIPVIAHENELILNSRQQAKLLFEIAKGRKTTGGSGVVIENLNVITPKGTPAEIARETEFMMREIGMEYGLK